MPNETESTTRLPAVDINPVPRWAWVVGVAAVVLWWLVTFENSQLLDLVGAQSAAAGNAVHELFHDARHLLGVPCH